jgi:uncharacterized protein YkwD
MSGRRNRIACVWLAVAIVMAHGMAQAAVLATVQGLRAGGCPRATGMSPLRVKPALSRAAEWWSQGSAAGEAAIRAGYAAERIAGLHLDGDESTAAALLRERYCNLFSDAALTDVGIYQRGPDTWLVLAAPFIALRPGDPRVMQRLLTLVNQARAQARRCGTRAMPAAPAVRLDPRLSAAAAGHAVDMARRDYFAHVDPENHSPADRVRRTGYDARVVGENLAVGAHSETEVVEGWLHSPGHCENLMDARFTDMGVGYAGAEPPRAGEYWVQVLALPLPVRPSEQPPS